MTDTFLPKHHNDFIKKLELRLDRIEREIKERLARQEKQESWIRAGLLDWPPVQR